MTRTFSLTLATLAVAVVALAGVAFAAHPAGPAGFWKFDEGAGATAFDSSGHANDGAIMGGAAYTAAGIAPVGGNLFALTFDGVDNFVEIANDSDLDMTAAYSVSVWANVTDVATYRPIVFRGATDANDIEVYVQSGSGDLIVAHNRGNGGIFDFVGFDDPPAGLFHLAITFDGTDVMAYYDGVAATVVQQATAVAPPLATTKGWWIGKVDHAAFGGAEIFFFKGLLDELQIFARALSTGEISALAAPPANACATPNTAPPGYTLQLGTTGNDTVVLLPFTMFVGKGGTDKVSGPDGNYIICLGSGSDTVTLGNGDVTINAGGGANVVTVGDGLGTIVSGSGSDKITTGDGPRTINAGSGANTIKTGDGDQTITTGSGSDKITTGDGSSTISAGGGANTITTGDGDKTITTGSGNDDITTGSGDDDIDAGSGKNTVSSGAGDDTVTAGSGNDFIDGGPDFDVCMPGSGANTVINCEAAGPPPPAPI